MKINSRIVALIFFLVILLLSISTTIDLKNTCNKEVSLFQQSTSLNQRPFNATPLVKAPLVPKKPNESKNKHSSVTYAIFGTDGRRNENSRSDVIMIIKYFPEEKELLIVSVPRDIKIEISGKGSNKINAAYAYGGPDLQILTLESLFDIEIDYFVQMNFNGFIDIINKLGGVRINAKKDFLNPYTNEVVIKKGTNVLNGDEALFYVRYRKDKDGDFGRIERQQEVFLFILKEILNSKSIRKLPEIINIIKTNLKTNGDLKELIFLALDVKSISNLNIESYTVKTHSQKIDGIWFEIIDADNLNFISTKLNGDRLSPE